ncbi:SDR family NAD(P)-dependent oxidoreductase [Lentisphaera profundi]|uniref:SDR family NAD(P)-dependent oxidoreductase n=1 Tax=Lentisphaera profundi TaxID=1658616 RepID=A0ABY7VP36_9BACT|nr:SDR family oxidoreductase [Lentisphaera profundi]WDE95910.1 SDR family NAD(P)-dependent oxidoreductase [Lentisphaera profundi]
MKDMTGKIALITGSTKGIGRAIAEAFVKAGADVIVNGRNATEVEKVRTEMGAKYGVAADLSSGEGCNSLIEQVDKIGPVEILINNTGIFGVKDFFESTDEEWENYFQLNVMSAVRLNRQFMKGMLERNSGSVINIASEAGFKPLPQMIHYSVSKTALISLSRGLAEITKGTAVTVNSLLPGPTWTDGVEKYFAGLAEEEGKDMQEVISSYFDDHEPTSLIKRFVDVKEVADATLFLATNKAVNGSALRVEGGIIRSL